TGLFLVSASYIYPAPGTYPITISVADNLGNTTTFSSSAIVSTNLVTTPANFGFTGGLDPYADNGSHVAMGYTNTNRPTFSGTAVPFATVQLFARFWGADAVQPLGEAVTNANGQWVLTVGPLAPGKYTFTGTVTPPGSYPIAVNLTPSKPIHIAMVP